MEVLPSGSDAADLRTYAFMTYERDLLTRLGLCSNGVVVFPCESPPPGVGAVATDRDRTMSLLEGSYASIISHERPR